MATWVCATCGPVPAGEIRHLDHDSPHGHETHECGSSAGLDWTTKEHEMSTTPVAAERESIARAIEALVIDLNRHDGYTTAIRDAAAVARQHTAASAPGPNGQVRLGDTCGPEHTYRDGCQYAWETK